MGMITTCQPLSYAQATPAVIHDDHDDDDVDDDDFGDDDDDDDDDDCQSQSLSYAQTTPAVIHPLRQGWDRTSSSRVSSGKPHPAEC